MFSPLHRYKEDYRKQGRKRKVYTVKILGKVKVLKDVACQSPDDASKHPVKKIKEASVEDLSKHVPAKLAETIHHTLNKNKPNA